MENNNQYRVWIIADSIAAEHKKDEYERPVYGWGELIYNYYTEEVVFLNESSKSQSTSSYIKFESERYNYLLNELRKNEIVIISFGHNDHNEPKLHGFDRRTDPYSDSNTEESFNYWLNYYYLKPVLNRGGIPILISPVCRCIYNKAGVFSEEDIHLEYAAAMQRLIKEYKNKGIDIPFLDATKYTYDLYSGLSFEQAMKNHALGNKEWGKWYMDTTHLSKQGADLICSFIVSELDKYDLTINKYRRR